MQYVVRKPTCIECHTVLKKPGALCEACLKGAPRIYIREMMKTQELEERFGRLWTQCQNCQGSHFQEIICANRDCGIFYMRTKVRKDLDQQEAVMKRFDGINNW